MKSRLYGICIMVSLILVAGCVASDKETVALRSDVDVLEKQFLQMQRDMTRLKYVDEENARGRGASSGSVGGAETGDPEETQRRLFELESRMDGIESQVRYLQGAGPSIQASPTPPEAVGLPDELAPPQVIVSPAEEDPGRPKPSRPVEEMYTEAVTIFRAGEFEKAEGLFARMLEEYPEDNKYSDNAQFYIGRTYMERGDYRRAVEEFDKVVSSYPVGDKVPDAIYMTGLSYIKLGLTDRARMSFNRVMDNFPYTEAAANARKSLDEID